MFDTVNPHFSAYSSITALPEFTSETLCQTDAILITCRQPFSEEITLPGLGVAKVGVSLRWRESGIDLESAGSTRSTAVYGPFIERNRLVSGLAAS